MTLTVGDVMSQSLHTIGSEQPLSVAHRRMQEHHIRHLPVLHGGLVVGMVSLGDLHLLETLRDVDPMQVTVEEAMTSDVYRVSAEMPLSDVAEQMAERKLGSAIIVDPRGALLGLFTTVDGLRVLVRMLRSGQEGAATTPPAPVAAPRAEVREAPARAAAKRRPAAKPAAKKARAAKPAAKKAGPSKARSKVRA